nr:MAG TPA: hypothetical protein [Caudoviricetes sp.]
MSFPGCPKASASPRTTAVCPSVRRATGKVV